MGFLERMRRLFGGSRDAGPAPRPAASVADGESPRLCLAHVLKAEGDELGADSILREEICNRSDDGEAPMELSERTKTIIRTHGWLAS